jgi:hypothetical protein
MFNLRGFIFIQVFLVILVSLISSTFFISNGYCDDDWVYVDSNIYYSMYYNSSSVKIDKQSNIIELLEKYVYTEKGKEDYFVKKNLNPEYIYLNHSVTLTLLDYKEWKFSINHITYYSKSGNVLLDGERPPKWYVIKKGSEVDILLNKLLEKYNIQR